VNNAEAGHVSFIVFGKDVGSGFDDTVSEILNAVKLIENITFQIIIVDDGSREFAFNESKYRGVSLAIIRLPKSVGISGAILAGTQLSKYENVFPIPGHNMYDSISISNVLNLLGKGRIIMGCRTNLMAERPFFKKIASRVMRDIYRHFTFFYVGDIHGLIMYKRSDLLSYLKEDDGHSNAIVVVTNVLASGGLLIQTNSPIKSGHKNARNMSFKNRFVAPRNVIKVLVSFYKIRNIAKKKF